MQDRIIQLIHKMNPHRFDATQKSGNGTFRAYGSIWFAFSYDHYREIYLAKVDFMGSCDMTLVGTTIYRHVSLIDPHSAYFFEFVGAALNRIEICFSIKEVYLQDRDGYRYTYQDGRLK